MRTIVPLALVITAHVGVAFGSTSNEAPIEVSSPQPVGKGSAVVLRPADRPAIDGTASEGDLLIHFHGAVDTIRAAMQRAGTRSTVMVVNQPGLSEAYAAPFRVDPKLFATLLAAPARGDATIANADPPRWRCVTLSCFSAGYGAVREILKDEQAFDRVDAIVAADSIYAGIHEPDGDQPGPNAGPRCVDSHDMAGFLAFATAATAGKKVFVITHSGQPTPYASTTETADYLLSRLDLERTAVAAKDGEEFPQRSRAGRGGFSVLGFAGASGPAHLFHLRTIDRWWQVAAEASLPR